MNVQVLGLQTSLEVKSRKPCLWSFVGMGIDLNLVSVCANPNMDLGLKGSRGLRSCWKYKVSNAKTLAALACPIARDREGDETDRDRESGRRLGEGRRVTRRENRQTKQDPSRGDLEGMLREARMRQANVHDCPRAHASETVAACLLRLGSPCVRRSVALAALGRDPLWRLGVSKLDMVYRSEGRSGIVRLDPQLERFYEP